jgi:ABC-type nickel/cobalt efflux system permease component RcnA
MLPSPSALLVLLAGIALHRTWLAIVLVVAYGAGMALTLCGAGLLVLRARGIGSRLPMLADHPFVRWLPVVAGIVVTLAGAQLLLRALLALI